MAEKDAKKKFYLYEKANSKADKSGYSFFIDGLMLDRAQKVTFTIVKRGKNNVQEDLGIFYLDYRIFRSLLKLMETTLHNRKKDGKYEKSFFGGADGGRRLVIKMENAAVSFNIYDNIVQKERKNAKDFKGSVAFFINDHLDLQELFDLKDTLSHWEITKIGKLVNYDPFKTKAEE